MGASSSQHYEYAKEFQIYSPIIDQINTKSIKYVHQKILNQKFKTKKQVQAVGTLLYEKAVDNPEMSLKCAQLAKLLENVKLKADGMIYVFRDVFNEFFFPFMTYIITKYDDNSVNERLILRGNAIATYVGNLFNAGFFNYIQIAQIIASAQEKETKKNGFFVDTLMDVLHNESSDIETLRKNFDRVSDNEAEDETHQVDFYKCLKEINENGYYCIVEDGTQNNQKHVNPKSKNIPKFNPQESAEKFTKKEPTSSSSKEIKPHQVDIKALTFEFFYDAQKNQELLNVYRDLAMEINSCYPVTFHKNLKKEFNSAIEQFGNMVFLKNDRYNFLEHLGKMVTEFYSIGLVGNEIVELFLRTAKRFRNASDVFKNTFFEVVKKFESPNMKEYYFYVKEVLSNGNLNEFESFCLKYCENLMMLEEDKKSSLTSHKDLQKHIPFRASPSEPFNCQKNLSCYAASQRSIDMLLQHIGNKFFNAKTLRVFTAQLECFPRNSAQLSDRFERELKVYQKNLKMDQDPCFKLKNFSMLLGSFYNKSYIGEHVILKWLNMLQEAIKQRDMTFNSEFLKMYFLIFQDVTNQLIHDDPVMWLNHMNFINMHDYKSSNFTQISHFRNMMMSCKDSLEFSSNAELQDIHIPNDRASIKQLIGYLIEFYIDSKSKPILIVSLYMALTVNYTPKLSKSILRTEFHEAIANKIGYFMSCDSTVDRLLRYNNCKSLIELVEVMSMKGQTTRYVIAKILFTISYMCDKNPVINAQMMRFGMEKLSKFLIGSKSVPENVENVIKETIERLRSTLDKLKKDFKNEEVNLILLVAGKRLEMILNDSKKKKSNEKENGSDKVKDQAVENKSLSLEAPKISQDITNKPEVQTENSSNPTKDPPQESKKPSVPTVENIKDYESYCEYFNSLTYISASDDNQLFNPNLISSLKFTKQQQIADFCNKIVNRVISDESKILFFVQNAIKIGNDFHSNSVFKNQNIQFKKILVDEVFKKFDDQKEVVEFMCELYNNNMVSKAQMIAFVDRFKSQKPENIELLRIFVKSCSIKLASQGDKEQLIQIRNFGKVIKNSTEVDENLRFIAKNVENSAGYLVMMLGSGQPKDQIFNWMEDSDENVENLLIDAMENPEGAVKIAVKFDEKYKQILVEKCQIMLNFVPDAPVTTEEFLNFVSFLATLYSSDVVKNEQMNSIFEVLLENTNDELYCKSLEIILISCGTKLEASNKSKLDTYFQFFCAVLSENEDSMRAEYFKKFIKLRKNNWTKIAAPDNYYEDFIMLYSIKNANVKELAVYLSSDDEEIIKFIQVLWKILLKEAPHPSHAVLCSELSNLCRNFLPALTAFLEARCKTFAGLSDDFYSDDVKERLGKVVTFVAELFGSGLFINNGDLEMWTEEKMIERIPRKFIGKIYKVLCRNGDKSYKLKILTQKIADISDNIIES